MPATPEELRRVVEAFEDAHHPILRALADLRLRGSIVLEVHGLFETRVEDRFDDFILQVLRDHGLTNEAFAMTLRDLDKMHATVDELERLL